LTEVSVVVLSWNTAELTLACLRSVVEAFDSEGIVGELVVVENASEDDSAARIASEFPSAKLICNVENRGYAAGVNQGVAASGGQWVLLLGSDARLSGGAISGLLTFMESAVGYGGCAPRLVDAEGETQRACASFPLPRTALWFGTPLQSWFPRSRELNRYFLRDFAHDVDADVVQPPATCLFFSREQWDSLAGMDEDLWLFFNDVDFCKRLNGRGLKLRYLSGLSAQHVGGASTALYDGFVERWHTDRLLYLRKHHGLLGAFMARLGTSWAMGAWALRRLFFLERDPFWGRFRGYLRFLRA
jgi:N-acetylglucosaminyl-diphospho-decaprenol L-rhamnosyltransferase